MKLIVAVVQSLSHVQLFPTPWIAAHQASLAFTISQSLLKLMSIESVMLFNHLILCCPLRLSSTFPNIRVFSNESNVHIRWPKFWSFSISPSNEYSGLILGLTGLISLLRVFSTPQESSPAPQFESISSSTFRRMYVHV